MPLRQTLHQYFFDTRSGNIDTWDSIDANTYDDVEVQLQIATTNDDPSGSPSWSDFKLRIVITMVVL